MAGNQPRFPTVGVGVVCLRDDQVLLVRRGRPPRLGEWSLPGGRLEWGETLAACAVREVREETGVEIALAGLVEVVDGRFGGAPDDPEQHYVLIDYAARWISGEPQAADDAAEAQFVSLDAALDLVSWAATRRVIRAAMAQLGCGGQAGVPQPSSSREHPQP